MESMYQAQYIISCPIYNFLDYFKYNPMLSTCNQGSKMTKTWWLDVRYITVMEIFPHQETHHLYHMVCQLSYRSILTSFISLYMQIYPQMQIDCWYVEISAFHLGNLTYGNISMTSASLYNRIIMHILPQQIHHQYVDISAYQLHILTCGNILSFVSLYMQIDRWFVEISEFQVGAPTYGNIPTTDTDEPRNLLTMYLCIMTSRVSDIIWKRAYA